MIRGSRLCNIPPVDLFLLWGRFHISVYTHFLLFVRARGVLTFRISIFPVDLFIYLQNQDLGLTPENLFQISGACTTREQSGSTLYDLDLAARAILQNLIWYFTATTAQQLSILVTSIGTYGYRCLVPV